MKHVRDGRQGAQRKHAAWIKSNAVQGAAGGLSASVRHGAKNAHWLHHPAAASVVHGRLWHACAGSQQCASLATHAAAASAKALQPAAEAPLRSLPMLPFGCAASRRR